MPFMPPFSMVNAASLRIFNTAYYHARTGDRRRALIDYAQKAHIDALRRAADAVGKT